MVPVTDPDAAVAPIAAAIGDRARARMLYCLVDGRARTSTELEVVANVTPSTASVHLQRDYWGVSQSLQEALAIFSPSDIKGALQPKHDELPRLQARHAAAMRFFNSMRHRNDLEQCVAVLAPEDVRAEHLTLDVDRPPRNSGSATGRRASGQTGAALGLAAFPRKVCCS